jgi:hypothetical protein
LVDFSEFRIAAIPPRCTAPHFFNPIFSATFWEAAFSGTISATISQSQFLESMGQNGSRSTDLLMDAPPVNSRS